MCVKTDYATVVRKWRLLIPVLPIVVAVFFSDVVINLFLVPPYRTGSRVSHIEEIAGPSFVVRCCRYV